MTKEELAKETIRRLEKVFPNKLELEFSNPFELLVAVVLAAQTTDKKVNEVTKEFFKRFKSPKDIVEADISEIESYIRSINYYRKKAVYLKKIAQILVEKYGGEVPRSIEELTKLPGIGRKSANIILYNAFGIQEGIAVDTHVARVAQRLGLTKEKDPEKIEQDLMRIVPKEEWGKFSNLVILLGRYVCTAQNPKHSKCPLVDICPSVSL
ncbi:endonuclease III [Thermocrinis minervae]|uniref:Endonuclease III n=1 Tax=Thermocrinis minervae TaxID=381751 RepID=A0A1M6R476_9AQUI|nr:endonuclease III [Thermocrinis minervae]SHK27252.1 DNA-(apurinic or apyrimidinic site) lyase /endonuclease III [Thermocrinis minervae]